MRIVARLLFLIVLAAGVVLAIVYPATLESKKGPQIGRWPVFERDRGFLELETVLSPYDTTLDIEAELRTAGPLRARASSEVVRLTISDGEGRALLASTVGFAGQPILESPQAGIYAYHAKVGSIPADGGVHRVAAAAGRDFDDATVSIHIALSLAKTPVDPRMRPAGFLLMAVGGVGFGLTLFRRRENPNSKPPPPRWGRT